MMLLAAAAALPFAPPVERPLGYAISERRGSETYRMTETATYARDGDDWIVTIVARTLDAAGPARARVEAGLRPWIGLPLRIRLSAAGEPIAVIDPGATWDALVAGVRATGAATMATALAAMPGDARSAALLHAADDIVPTALPAIAPGATAAVADGTATREGDGRFVLRRRLAGPEGALTIVDRIDVAPATGLVATRVRTRTAADGTMLGETRIEALGD